MVKFVIVVELASMEIQRGRIVDNRHWIIQMEAEFGQSSGFILSMYVGVICVDESRCTRFQVDCSFLKTATISLKPGYNVIKIFSIRLRLS